MGWQYGVEHVDDSGASTVSAEFDATLVGTVWSAAAPLCISCLEILLRTSAPLLHRVFDRPGLTVEEGMSESWLPVAGREWRSRPNSTNRVPPTGEQRLTLRVPGFLGSWVTPLFM